jgi:hypothetical protein
MGLPSLTSYRQGIFAIMAPGLWRVVRGCGWLGDFLNRRISLQPHFSSGQRFGMVGAETGYSLGKTGFALRAASC